MKANRLAVLLAIGLMASCSDDANSPELNLVVSTVTSGTWRITYFWDTDKDETSNFTGYSFTFGSSNVLTAVKGATTHTGTWSVTDSNSKDDSLDDLDFNIAFAAPPDFEELTEDWKILERTNSKIRLEHVSGGNGGTDYLTFEKN